MAVLDTCCLCCSLRTGTIVTGLLGVMIGVATLVVVLVTDAELKTIVIDTLPSNIVRIILAVNLVMTILISTLLVIGAVKRRRLLLLPWLALALMLALGMLVSVLYTAATLLAHRHRHHDDYVRTAALWLGIGLPAIALYVYLWLVAFSFYQRLQVDGGRHYDRAPTSYRH